MTDHDERVLVSVPTTEITARFEYELPASLFGRSRVIAAFPYVHVPQGASHEEIKSLLRERFEEAVTGMLNHYDVVVETLAGGQEAAPAGT